MQRHPAIRVAAVVCLCASLAASSGAWLDVPFIRQSKEGCGSASLAMVMQYWLRHQGREIPPEAQEGAIFRALYSPEAGGIYASALEGYLRENGFDAFAFRGTWDDLRQHLEKGRPLLAALKPDENAQPHFVVVVGIDWDRGLVLLNDPARRKLLKQERRSFEKSWQSAGNWTLLALPRSRGG